MTLYSADLLTANRLTDALSIGDRAAREEELPFRRVDIGKRRSFADHFPADAPEHGERPNDDDGQCHPIPLIRVRKRRVKMNTLGRNELPCGPA